MTEEQYDETTILDMIFNYLKSQGLEPEFKGFRIKVDGGVYIDVTDARE
jgi:hypothetical protein